MNRREALAAATGAEVTEDSATEPPTFTVPADGWETALRAARDELGYRYFDWLSAVDELESFTVVVHLAAVGTPGTVDHLLIRAVVDKADPTLASVVEVFPGAAWHERETHEMFGIEFAGHPGLTPLLLPDEFEGHPLRKDFVLAARVAKPWPGAKEPGESDGEARKAPARRKVAPPGVPSPSEWGPRAPGETSGGEAE